MKITTKNYFETIKKIGFEKLPLVLKQSHTVIMTKTDMGADWDFYKSNPDFKRMVDLAFLKLQEFMKSKSVNGMDGVKTNKTKENPYSKIVTEVYFIDRFLKFHDQVLYKNTFGIFIEDLQKAIIGKRITKKSPVAKDIMDIQRAAINAFNTMYNAKHFVLKPTTIKRFKSIIEKYDNSHDDIDKEYVKSKKKSVSLEGIQNPDENIMSSKEFTTMEFDTIGLKDKWLDFMGDPAPGFTAMVFGMPKMGKSYLCVDFANYLSLNHGKVLYVSKEEFMSPTLAIKFKDKDAANDNLDIAGSIPNDLSPYDFIFLDSVTSLKLSPEDLKHLEEKYPEKSFVYVFQVTKNGKARGTNEFMHNVDVVIEIPEKGKAVQFGRFNQGGEIDIFEDAPSEKKEASELSGIKKSKKKDWTEPEWLNAADWHNLKIIKKYCDEGKYTEAMEHARSCDTVIREEIPGDIWKKMGGQLTPSGEAKLRKNRKLLSASGKGITKATELGIPLEELAIEMLPKKKSKTEIIDLIYNETARVEDAVTIMAQQAIIDEKLKITVKSVKFKENDSDNISHGASYFNVVLEGAESELKKIAGADKLFYCEW
jgi:hypothetical protein